MRKRNIAALLLLVLLLTGLTGCAQRGSTAGVALVADASERFSPEEIDSAMINPTAPTAPVSRNGTASGISAPRMPVVDANAETTPPT